MLVKSAREIELEECLKELLQGVADEGIFNQVCGDGKAKIMRAAELVDFPKSEIGEPVEIFLEINTSNFISKYFDTEEFDCDDFEVVSIVVKHKGETHNLEADDVNVYEA